MYTLKLGHEAVTPDSPNYRSATLSPPSNFPISVRSDGEVVSRYSDPSWDLTPYSNETLALHFGDAKRIKKRVALSHDNVREQRQLSFYLLYGDRKVQAATTIQSEHKVLLHVFKRCEMHGITASTLHRYENVYLKLAGAMAPNKARRLVVLMHELYEAREQIGFHILDHVQIAAFAKKIANDDEEAQHAYIPPRIWNYISSRCQLFLDDYLAHQEKFEALFDRCLSAYEEAYGSISAFRQSQNSAFRHFKNEYLRPFAATSANPNTLGRFADEARRFGVADVIERWVIPIGRTIDDYGAGIKCFSKYLTAVQFVGRLFLIMYSAMRRKEGAGLRVGCWEVDSDPVLGTSHLLRGATTKTGPDPNAFWVTAPVAKKAVDAMTSVANLRTKAAMKDSTISADSDAATKPLLYTRSYEPWGDKKKGNGDCIPSALWFWRLRVPRLFDESELRITADDHRVALLVTPTLDVDRFAVGKVWPLTAHQLRRTLPTNAVNSGLVSDESVQIQLKHVTLGMGQHYTRNHSRVPTESSMRAEYETALIEALVMKAKELVGDRYVSPHGDDHKKRLTAFVSGKDHAALVKLAKLGKLTIRETACGLCLLGRACPYGGWDYIVECIDCDKALFDTRKRSELEALDRDIETQRASAKSTDTPLLNALDGQQKAVRGALQVTARGNP